MRRALRALLLGLLAACGGGGGESSPTDPDEPNDSFTEATPLTPGTTRVGAIASATDSDFYSFPVPAGGGNVRFQTFDLGGTQCDPVGEAVDPWIEVYDGAQTFLDDDDDSGVPPWCEDLTVFLPAGTSYVVVRGFEPFPFVYTLRVTLQ